jgi:uncharacterized membrane protein YphA (DoxX/SURF4 family)
MKIFRTICRILVGIVFIFSGFVKGVDPLGTVFRMQDYFIAFGIPWANQFALVLTLFLITLEFVIGFCLLFNLWIRTISFILLPLMIYFTVLTFFDATFNIVPDCGCFGDALKLTNLQTFLKNIVLMIFVVPIFLQRKKFKPAVSLPLQLLLIFLAGCLFTGMSVHSYRHLPLIDFMPWKVGKVVNKKESTGKVKFYVTYRNKKTGEEKEYLTPNYPWNDSVWMSEWVFKSQRTDDPNREQALNLRIEDERGIDNTAIILGNPDLQFLFISYDLATARKEAFHKILPFYKKAVNDGYSFVCITNAVPAEVRKFRIENGTAFDYYLADDVVLKTMVRSNPGLILLKNGKVLAKWHYHDFPTYEEVIRQFGNH